MAHHRTVSVGSISSLSSLSSEEAVETYRDPLLQQSITTTLTSTQPSLEALHARAGGIIESFATHEKRVYEYQGKTVNLDRILAAMLHHSERAGGEHSKRYMSSAIVASYDADESYDKLVAVAVTWLTHLLYICMWLIGSESTKPIAFLQSKRVVATRTNQMLIPVPSQLRPLRRRRLCWMKVPVAGQLHSEIM